MKVRLLYPDRDADFTRTTDRESEHIVADLGMGGLITTIAAGDPYVADVMTVSLFDLLTDVEAIRYRQSALADAVKNADTVVELYRLSGSAIDDLRKHIFYSLGRLSPEQYMNRSLSVVDSLSVRLRELAELVGRVRRDFASRPFGDFFDECARLLTPQRLDEVARHLREVSFDHGALLSVRLGEGVRGTDYTMVKPAQHGLLDRVFAERGLSFQIAPRDVTGAKIVGELRGRGVREVAGTLADAADTMERFFRALHWEAAFYIGAARLFELLESAHGRVCLPVPVPLAEPVFAVEDLYDPALALHLGRDVVPSGIDAGTGRLVVVTGANQGGKSTFLRAVGQAQLMMQAGLPVAASGMRAQVRSALFTHFKREEDREMVSGKLDEEMARMSRIIDAMPPSARGSSIFLFNESFASTNEGEGAQIAEGIVGALLESGHRVFFVTHMYELARRLYEQASPADRASCFLRPQRRDDGTRTFRVVPAEPEPTSYGQDLYRQIFGAVTTSAPTKGG
ncbi:DNA mismatch repair protein MutS [Gordonia sp. X0973]|uniref:MutS-related protein n=1 Tax=Gordonia sp. X0973 TaxID=2742602 RepID=UPI000F53BF17|nr:DNA mismatch repair protein MutS [Gordonia sp. X0973]QKT07037.1 DNA mismatch repair protein MutS [Gordonia sp. X0973]